MNRAVSPPALLLAAAAAWSVAVGAHELIGHGGACLLVEGCHGRYADAMYFDFAYDGGMVGRAAILIGGPLATFLIGLAALIWRLVSRSSRPALDWFAWALIPACWISGGAYVALGQFIHPGMDTAQLARMGGDGAPFLIAGLGGVMILAGLLASALLMPVRTAGWARLWIVAATVGGYALSAFGAAFFVPGDRIFLLYGAFGASVLFTASFWLAALPWPTVRPKPATRGPGFAAHLVLLAPTLAYVFILGPGIGQAGGG